MKAEEIETVVKVQVLTFRKLNEDSAVFLLIYYRINNILCSSSLDTRGEFVI